jgi:hypothetical protein
MLSFERRWARHLLASFAPVGSAGLAPVEGEVDYVQALVRMMRGATPLAALGLRLALWLAALAPIWLWGRLATVTKLASERRTELLAQLLGHRAFAVRELTLLLKLCAAMALLGTPSVRARSGYDTAPERISVRPSSHPERADRVRLPIAGSSVQAVVRPSVRAAEPSGDGVARGGP